MTPRFPVPLRPDYAAPIASQSKAYWRGVGAAVLGVLTKTDRDAIIKREWGVDENASYFARAATTPATTSSNQSLLGLSRLPYITLAPQSVTAKLAQAGALPLDFTGTNQAVIPRIATAPTAAWVSEGGGASIVQPVYESLIVNGPKKLLFGAVVTAELANYTADLAVAIIKSTLTDAATLALDSVFLGSAASSATQPAGLLYNVSDLGATAGGGLTALVTDLAKLAGAISDAGIETESLLFAMNPAQAIVARGLLTGPQFANYTVVGTSALSAGTIAAFAPAGIAMYVSAPQIEISPDGLVVLDTEPDDIVTAGTVSTGTVKSAWQAQLLLLKLRLKCAWAPLHASAVQVITSATW